MPRRPLTVAAVLLAAVLLAAAAALSRLPAPEPPPALPALPPRGEPVPTDPHRPYPYGRVAVIAAGVNGYPNLTGEDASLRCAEADAVAFADLTAAHYGYETTRLIGPEASKRGIELAVKRTAEELGPDDALIFFFAGHGQVIELPGAGEAGFLLPQDAALDMKATGRLDAWRAQAVNVHELFARASESRARHVLFVLDACKSGIATGRGQVGDRADIKAFVFEKSRAVLAAVRRDQTAREDVAAGHGRFTAALLARLRSTDPATALDVYQQVSRDVAAASSGTMLPQFGQVAGDGMVVFIPKSIPREEVERDLANAPVGPLAAPQARAAELLKQRTTDAEVLEAFRTLDYRPSPDAEDRAKIWEPKFQRFRRNAGLGDAKAMAALSLCYAKGLGTATAADLAYDWARQADRTPNPPGLGRWALGLCLENATGVAAKNPAAAEKLFREAAAAGFPPAKLSLARLLSKSAAADAKEIRRLLTEAGDGGLAEALAELADVILAEKTADRKANVAEAQRLYTAAAEQGQARGEFGLYRIFTDGRPGFPPRDFKAAERHLRKAADAGLPEAIFNLGREYQNTPADASGLPLAPDEATARRHYERAARLNYAPALVNSAFMLARGAGGPADENLARERVDAAVLLDFPRAYTLKGTFYQTGMLYPKDDRKVFEWFQQAADRKDPLGCAKLGHAYWTRAGTPDGGRQTDKFEFHADTATAAHWLTLALVLDPDRRDPAAHKIAEPLLEDLRGAHNIVRLNIPLGVRGLKPAAVFKQWNKTHPETFASFCERFEISLDAK